MDATRNIIGDRLRAHRQALQLSQEAVAERAGLHPTYIGQLERGEKNATMDSITKIAIALALPLESLFAGIVPGDGAQNATALACYNLILTQTADRQQDILDIIQKIVK